MPNTRFDWVGPGLVIAGRYRIESPLGEGGYGAVYVATQLGLDRKVALKLLHPEVLVRERARERFTREAQVTQSLSHPNVVRLFEFGTSEQGLPYIVTELLDGRSLEQELVARGPMPAARVAHITQQLLKGLAEAHQRGIVHRDVKPANVFLCDYAGEPDFVKILDFGIAAAPREGNAGLTQEGVSLGTPAYMSPEQVLDQPLDGRSDLYSVGLVMAEMLSGQPVFQGTVAMQLALAQIAPEPVPLAPHVVSSPIGAFVVRATHKDKEQRFASALDMLHALRQTMGSLGLSAPLPPAPVAALAGHAGAPIPTLPSNAPPPGQAVPYVRAAGSVSMPLAAPAQPLKRASSSVGWIVACALLGAIAIAAVTYAVTLTRLGGAKKTVAAPKVVATATAAPGPPVAEQDVEQQMDQLQKQVLDQLLKLPSGDPLDVPDLDVGCGELSPTAAAFSVKGVSVPQVIERMGKAGFQCFNHTPSGDGGNLMFVGQPGDSVMIDYRGGPSASGVAGFQNALVYVEPDRSRLYWVMGVKPGSERARVITDILYPQPGAPSP